MKNRLGIFVFFEEHGSVDKYVDYFLDELSKNVSDLIIVSNSPVNKIGVGTFKKYTNKIILRQNIGYDGYAYRQVILDEIGRENICTYDELVLCNDTCYGPLYPLDEVFECMNNSVESDYWGITQHPKFLWHGEEKEKHLQSYFVVFKKKLILSDEFWCFWKDMPLASNFDEAVVGFEMALSEKLCSAGFKYDTYCKCKDLESDDILLNYNYHHLKPYEMISKYNCPFIKKKSLLDAPDVINEFLKVIQYVRDNTGYDEKLILNNIERIRGVSVWINKLYEASIQGAGTDYRKIFEKNNIKQLANIYKDVYIYGYGTVAKRISGWCQEMKIKVKAYIVSDISTIATKECSENIVDINQYKDNKNSIIILGLNKKNTKDVIDILDKKGIKNYWCLMYD